MEQLRAIERVCDKRHARIISSGKTEREASDSLVAYLQSWLRRFPDSSAFKREFVTALLDGYAA